MSGACFFSVKVADPHTVRDLVKHAPTEWEIRAIDDHVARVKAGAWIDLTPLNDAGVDVTVYAMEVLSPYTAGKVIVDAAPLKD